MMNDISGVIVGLIFLVLVLALLPMYMTVCEGFIGGISDNFTLQSIMVSREDLNRGYERKNFGVDAEEPGRAVELASARPYSKCGNRVVDDVDPVSVLVSGGEIGVKSVAGITREEEMGEEDRGRIDGGMPRGNGRGYVDYNAKMERRVMLSGEIGGLEDASISGSARV